MESVWPWWLGCRHLRSMTLTEIFRGPLTTSKWQALGRYLTSQQITGGGGIRIARDVHGTIITARPASIAFPSPAHRHPYQIRCDIIEGDPVLFVGHGAATTQYFYDSGGFPVLRSIATRFDSVIPTYLENDPINPTGTVGFSTLTASTDYGVWLVLEMVSTTHTNGLITDDEYAQLFQMAGDVNTCRVDVSTSQVSGDDYYVGGPGEVGFYIGKVSVDSAGSATITQVLRSDVVVPVVVVPKAIVHP